MAFKPTFKQYNYKNYKKKDYNNNKSYSNYGSQQLRKGEKLVVSKFAEMKTRLEKEYYATIETKEGSKLIFYTSKFLHEAMALFEEKARLEGGKVGVVGFLN
jgi:hypothetical protein